LFDFVSNFKTKYQNVSVLPARSANSTQKQVVHDLHIFSSQSGNPGFKNAKEANEIRKISAL
jgi:hypothetical protein